MFHRVCAGVFWLNAEVFFNVFVRIHEIRGVSAYNYQLTPKRSARVILPLFLLFVLFSLTRSTGFFSSLRKPTPH